MEHDYKRVQLFLWHGAASYSRPPLLGQSATQERGAVFIQDLRHQSLLSLHQLSDDRCFAGSATSSTSLKIRHCPDSPGVVEHEFGGEKKLACITNGLPCDAGVSHPTALALARCQRGCQPGGRGPCVYGRVRDDPFQRPWRAWYVLFCPASDLFFHVTLPVSIPFRSNLIPIPFWGSSPSDMPVKKPFDADFTAQSFLTPTRRQQMRQCLLAETRNPNQLHLPPH
jgi:hypothetical protein